MIDSINFLSMSEILKSFKNGFTIEDLSFINCKEFSIAISKIRQSAFINITSLSS